MAAGGGRHPGSKVDLESFLTCSICMEPFRQPKILPCVHSFCLQCLKSYLSSISTSSSIAYKRKGGFPCPTCRQHVPVAKTSKPPETWPDQLKDNFVMSSMLEAFQQQQQQQQQEKPQSSAPHADSSASQPADGARAMAESGTASCTCLSAPEMVCWDCAALLCATCALTAHAECRQVQNVSKAGPDKRQEMLDWLPPLNEHLTDLERRHDLAEATLQSMRARRQAMQDQISQAASDAIQMVHLQEQKLRQTMEKEFTVILQRYQQRQKAYSAAMDDLNSLKEALERCVLEKDVDLLRQVQCLEQRYAALAAPAEVMAGEGEDEDQDQDQDLETGVFLPVSLAELKSTVLVGVYHHKSGQSKTSALQSPVTSPEPTSPSTSEHTSWTCLQDGPVLYHRPRCQSLPSSLPLALSPDPAETTATSAATGEEGSGSAAAAPCTLSSPLLLSGRRPVMAQQVCTFPARAKGDKAEPLIRDLVVLSNGWLVATDTANRCVKCYFKNQPDEVKYHCKRLVLSHAPYGVCSVEGQLVAVTVPKERQLQMMMARPHLVPLTTLTLPLQLQEPVWAVSSLGEQRLAATTCPQGEASSVLILQVNGESVQCVARYTSLVTTPLYTAVTTDHHIVTTDPTSGHVACITSDTGHCVFHFHTNGKVMGVTCLSQLLLLVDQSPALYLLTNEGRCLHTVALPKGKAGCSHPRAVAVTTDDTIFVSDDNGKVHIFNLRWQDSMATGT